jgi:Flp pilus assembly secretin CpaC
MTRYVARNTSVSMASLAIGTLAFSLSTVAQDVMLKIDTTVGEGRPQASEHKIAAGTETVSAPSIVARVGQKASVAQGTEAPHPKNLHIDVTPSL